LNRRVAIKIPIVRNAKALEKIALEARQLAQLKHPGIVTVYDAGMHNGQFYIVSDFVEGTNLYEWLKLHRPTWQETARIVADVAEALAHAHTQRTIHRDIRPQNVILKNDKRPVLADFGLAISDEVSPRGEIGIISGTPDYMSPDQGAGKGHRIDGRTDIYALGSVLYYMLCGRHPFLSTDTREMLRQLREDDPQPPRQLVPDIPVEMERICLKAMAKRPTDRYTTALDLAHDLRQLLGAPPESTRLKLDSSSAVLSGSKQLDSPSAIRRARQAERRLVTALFCHSDLLDSEALLQALDPEDQHEL